MSSSDNNGADAPLTDGEFQKFEEMLPWLINGTLNETERKELELALAQSEKLRQEKAVLTLLQQQIKQQEMPNAPIEFSWQKVKKQIAVEKKQLQNDSYKSEKKWRYIGIAASVLLVVQSSNILVNWNQDDTYRPLSSSADSSKVNAAQFTLQFADETTARDIQQVLRQYNLNIISGPSSVGLYKISGPSDSNNHAEKILSQLRARTDIIVYVQQNE